VSYQVLARKWRPKNFQQLVGQEHVVSVLTNALSQQRLHHAYLFTGTRGVGKTTIARIFAKSLNCQQGISAMPCGECDVCLDIDQGRFIDLLEIDAASRTKVDDTREILDNVQYAPSRGRYKVYLIDEVHMLSRSSFNALLKTLEEPPEHVKFILATTDPQKLPVTVLSRCLQFHLKALTRNQIEQKLTEILNAESVSVEEGCLALLSRAARGSMRDCLSLTDQAIAQGQGHITLANLQQMLGSIDHHWPYKILVNLLKQDSKALMQLSLEIASYAPNYSRLLADLLQLLHQIALYQITQTLYDLHPEHAKLVEKFSQAMSPDDVQLYYQIVLNGRKDLPYAADEQAAFDMVLLRLLAFQPMAQPSQNAQPTISKAIDSITTEQLADTSITPNIESSKHKIVAVEMSAKEHQQEQQLTAEMLSIEQQAFEQGYQPNSNEAVAIEQLTAEESEPHTRDLDSVSAKNDASSSNDQPEAIEQILAQRNILRSKRKQLTQSSKKSSDAVERQLNTQPTTASLANDPMALAEVNDAQTAASVRPNTETTEIAATENPTQVIQEITANKFSEDLINPEQHKYASEVDRWAHMIEQMQLKGRLRQLAIHATIDKSSSAQQLILNVDHTLKHLLNENAQAQLQQKLRDYFQQPLNVIINIEATVEDKPFAIQQNIDEKRQAYATQVIMNDPFVHQLSDLFQANIEDDSIKPV
jgi:DNA polymerase-3 subunit gamma/tau